MFKRLLTLITLAVMLGVTNVEAQVTIPNIFVTQQVISSSKMNANFNTLGTQALNRTAPILQATVTVDTNNAYDLGSVGFQFRNAWLGGTFSVGGTSTFTGLLTANGGIATTTITATGLVNVNGGALQFTANGTYPGGGAIVKNAVDGLIISGVAGSTFDFALLNPAGNAGIISIPTGTVNVQFSGTIGFPTTASFTTAGTILKHSVDGLLIAGIAGSGNDFTITSPAGGPIISVPTGTLNVTLGGTLTMPGLLTVNGAGQNVFSASVAGGAEQIVINNTHAAGASQFSGLLVEADNGGLTLQINQYSASANPGFADGPGGVNGVAAIWSTSTTGLALGTNVAGPIGFYAGSGLHMRFGINSNGDFTFGPSQHLFASVGTPTCSTFCGSIGAGGIDTAFSYQGTGSSHGVVIINFGHTFSNTPSCTVTMNVSGIGIPFISAISTTSVSISYSIGSALGEIGYVNCIGY